MGNEEIKVSVICPAYNHENLIRSALDGFVMQKTDFRFEVLVHDDASTDGTAAVIREYAERYPEIFVPIYQTENQYSKGVKVINDIMVPKARGKYLAFCEGDDFWTDPNKLQRQVAFLDSHPEYTACVHNSVVHDCTGKKADYLHVEMTEEHDVTFEMVAKGMSWAYQTSALVMRKELNDSLPDFYYIAVSYGFGDWPKAFWLILNGKIRFFSEAMSTYRLMSNPNAWSARDFSVKKRIRNLEGYVAMLEAVKVHVEEKNLAPLNEKIIECKFNILILNEQYDDLKRPPYDTFWNRMSAGARLKIWVKKNFPGVYHRLRRIKP